MKLCVNCGVDLRSNNVRIKYCSDFCQIAALSKATQSGCIECAAVNSEGYGVIKSREHDYSNLLAHRRAFELAFGEIPEGMKVCHSCDNRRCVNLDHLFLGTDDDNKKDSMRKKRHAFGERSATCQITENDALAIFIDARRKADIARAFGVSFDVVRCIKNGRSWSWLTGKIYEAA